MSWLGPDVKWAHHFFPAVRHAAWEFDLSHLTGSDTEDGAGGIKLRPFGAVVPESSAINRWLFIPVCERLGAEPPLPLYYGNISSQHPPIKDLIIVNAVVGVIRPHG